MSLTDLVLLQVEIERCSATFAKDPCYGQLQALLRACMLLRAEMAHFTTNMQYYINLEVLECEGLELGQGHVCGPTMVHKADAAAVTTGRAAVCF
jgi:hypothetical protein